MTCPRPSARRTGRDAHLRQLSRGALVGGPAQGGHHQGPPPTAGRALRPTREACLVRGVAQCGGQTGRVMAAVAEVRQLRRPRDRRLGPRRGPERLPLWLLPPYPRSHRGERAENPGRRRTRKGASCWTSLTSCRAGVSRGGPSLSRPWSRSTAALPGNRARRWPSTSTAPSSGACREDAWRQPSTTCAVKHWRPPPARSSTAVTQTRTPSRPVSRTTVASARAVASRAVSPKPPA